MICGMRFERGFERGSMSGWLVGWFEKILCKGVRLNEILKEFWDFGIL